MTTSARCAISILLGGLLITLLLAVPSMGWAAPTESASRGAARSTSSAKRTVVSITFDDGQATQFSVYPVLRAHDIPATFYVNSGMVGSSRFYMGWQQLSQLANAGNEIGGHTSHHMALDRVSEHTAKSEICGDRDHLIREGFAPVTSFAYPTVAVRPSTSAVRSCGYSSARAVVTAPRPHLESIPPGDPYLLPLRQEVSIGTTVGELQRTVTTAEQRRSGTHWAILVFHAICDNSCTSQEATTMTRFTQFVGWLDAERSAGRIAVRTVGDVVANGLQGSTAPHTTMTCKPSPCSHASRSSVRVNLEVTGARSGAVTYYTTDGTDPKTSASWQRFTHPFAVSGLTQVRFYSRDTAGHSESAHIGRIRAGVADTTSYDSSDQALGVTRSRQLVAGASFLMFMGTLLAVIVLLRRRLARLRLQPRR